MIRGMIFAIVILAVLTAWFAHRLRNRTVRALWVVPLYGGLACLFLGGVVGVYYSNTLRLYDQCIARAERSADSREQTEQLYDTIDVVAGTDKFTSTVILDDGRMSLRFELDQRVPVIDESSCEKPR